MGKRKNVLLLLSDQQRLDTISACLLYTSGLGIIGGFPLLTGDTGYGKTITVFIHSKTPFCCIK